MRVILFVLLAVDCVQFALGLAALERGRRSARAGAPSHARYSFAHGLVLLTGAVLLAVPVLLGLFGAISASVAVYSALVLELAGFLISRPAVKRLEAAHQARRPGVPLAG